MFASFLTVDRRVTIEKFAPKHFERIGICDVKATIHIITRLVSVVASREGSSRPNTNLSPFSFLYLYLAFLV